MHESKETKLTLGLPALGIKVTKDIFHSSEINPLARKLLKRFTKSSFVFI